LHVLPRGDDLAGRGLECKRVRVLRRDVSKYGLYLDNFNAAEIVRRIRNRHLLCITVLYSFK
jgi:hypothetical protein